MLKRKIGEKYEKMAKIFLENKGLKFIDKNFFSIYGEIDLIFLDIKTTTLIFIEVKYRKSKKFGSALEVIDRSKIQKIYMTSQIYLAEKEWKYGVRYDVIGIEGYNDFKGYDIGWIKNAF